MCRWHSYEIIIIGDKMRLLTQTTPFTRTVNNRIVAMLSATIFSITTLIGCSSTADQQHVNDDPKSYIRAYHQALKNTEQSAPPSQQSIDNFIAVFTSLNAEDLPQKMEEAYAENLYFSDTLNVINTRSTLIDYLTETGERLDEINVTIVSVSHDDADVYVRWEMETKFSVWGKDIDAHSVGISQLRFNEQGKVVLHQDFWDSSEGLLTHLPFVGGIVRWTRNRL